MIALLEFMFASGPRFFGILVILIILCLTLDSIFTSLARAFGRKQGH